MPVATRYFIRKQMNRPGSRSNSSERPCGLSAFIPFEVDCRGKVEAFARNLQTRLHSLGSFVSSLPSGFSGCIRLLSVFSRPRRSRKPSRAPSEIHGLHRQNVHSRRRSQITSRQRIIPRVASMQQTQPTTSTWTCPAVPPTNTHT